VNQDVPSGDRQDFYEHHYHKIRWLKKGLIKPVKNNRRTNMKIKKLQALIGLVGLTGATQLAQAAIIPYPNIGTENPVTYTFTATASGDVVGYFAATTSAEYTEEVGLMVNGVLTSNGYGLNNHSSSVGSSFDFGTVVAGDTLVFVLNVIDPPDAVGTVYSDPSMNASYDGGIGQNHVYSVAYDASSDLLDPSVPSGTYVAFEDLPATMSDWNYADDTFVFTDTSVTAVPEATTVFAGMLLLLPFGMSTLRILKRNRTA
jgi:hypothetical protein